MSRRNDGQGAPRFAGPRTVRRGRAGPRGPRPRRPLAPQAPSPSPPARRSARRRSLAPRRAVPRRRAAPQRRLRLGTRPFVGAGHSAASGGARGRFPPTGRLRLASFRPGSANVRGGSASALRRFPGAPRRGSSRHRPPASAARARRGGYAAARSRPRRPWKASGAMPRRSPTPRRGTRREAPQASSGPSARTGRRSGDGHGAHEVRGDEASQSPAQCLPYRAGGVAPQSGGVSSSPAPSVICQLMARGGHQEAACRDFRRAAGPIWATTRPPS